MAQDRFETIGVILDRGVEGELGELGQAGGTNRWPKAKSAELLETFPGGHALVLLESVVPRLGGARKMVCQLGTVQGQGALATEKLLSG